MKKLRKNKKGFTLIELIVVMAILAVLVLLAAPRFLNYTKQAEVTTMQADAKVLSNAALIYNTENGGWPIVGVGAEDTIGGITVEVAELDSDKFEAHVQTLKNDIDDYVMVTKNVEDEDADVTLQQGDILHKIGKEDREGNMHYGVNFEVPVTP